MAKYQTLDPEKIVETVQQLERRICDRFPKSGLGSICAGLSEIARQSHARALWLSRPIWPLRILLVVIIGLILALLVSLAPSIDIPKGQVSIVDFLQGVEAAANDLLLSFAGLFFLFTWEVRIKRNRALRALHELRSLAHIIDMHQLTKDPERISGQPRAEISDEEVLTPLDLGRYLDYCTDMLSLTGKIAALYAENLNDPVVLAAVNEVETVSTGLARKIWQKIMLIHGVPVG